ncbi:MAG: hypothetical protein GEV04_20090 [Actinophytocola sp.]|nr:hypothetical protein [Actinophytocola sp.]
MREARKLGGIAAGVTVAFALSGGAAPAGAAVAETTIDVHPVSVVNGSIPVTGTVSFGADAVGPVTVSQDPDGDAQLPGFGYDIGDVSFQTDLAAERLIVTLHLHDAPSDDPAPFTGYQVPLLNDGADWWRWLGAGGVGSNQAQTEPWGGLCENENEAEGGSGGWSCTDRVPTTFTADSVVWELPFATMKPPIKAGSVLESSGILCGAPCAFQWPSSVVLSLAPMDTSFPMEQYKVPGDIRLGIAPEGTPASRVNFAVRAAFDAASGDFSETLAAPAASGSYTVWARTCFGSPISCVFGSTPVDVTV